MKTRTEAAREVWRSASSFDALCDLSARWITGDLPFHPAYHGSAPDPEINVVVEPLVQLNRRGWLTVISQPGEQSGAHAQRAWVEGFAQEGLARSIAKKALYTDLHILVFPPGVERGYMTPVTVRDGRPCTWAGTSSPQEVDVFAEVCSPEALRQLNAAWYVIAIDLAWGRTGHLWTILLQDDRPDLSAELDPFGMGAADRAAAERRVPPEPPSCAGH